MKGKKTMTLGGKRPMPSLSVKLPPYTVAKIRSDGSRAFYFQVPAALRPKGWPATFRLPTDPQKRSGEADAAEIAAVVADATKLYSQFLGEKAGVPEAAKYGTLPWLVAAYEQSERFKKRAKNTKRNYAYCARLVLGWSEEAGHPLVSKIKQPAILTWLSTMDEHPRKRNQVASYLRVLLAFAVSKGLRDTNPAEKLGLERAQRKKMVHIWTDAEVAERMAAAEAIGRPSIALAILIAHDQGFRPSDVLRLQKGKERAYDQRTGRFKYRCQKTDEWVECDATERVRARIAAQPAEQLCIIVNEQTGEVYNERVFNRWFDKARGNTDLWFRHLRHTHVVKARRAGLDSKEIAGRTGHSVTSVDKILEAFYSPHDTEVIQRGAAKFEAYLAEREQKSDTGVGRQLDAKA